MIRSMEKCPTGGNPGTAGEKILTRLFFGDIGFIMNDGEIYGSSSCAVSDIKKKKLDEAALASDTSFNSDPYQSSRTGNMTMTVLCQ